MNKAIVVNAGGTTTHESFTNETFYDVVSTAVGGYIERVQVAPNLVMWVNENGLNEKLEPNLVGSLAYLLAFGKEALIVGNIVFTGVEDEEGYSLGVDQQGMEALVQLGEIGLMLAQAEEHANEE